MSQVIFALGGNIYKAAVAGAAKGYNRTTNDHQHYERAINALFHEMLSDLSEAESHQVEMHTGNDWRKTYLPLCLAMYHHHKKGVPCEVHARVYLLSNPGALFDIPISDWKLMQSMQPRGMRAH